MVYWKNMDIIKYHLRTDEEGRTVAGWTMNLDGKEYGKEVTLDDDYEPDEDLEMIVRYNAGDNLANIILGPAPFPDLGEDPSTSSLLRLEAALAGRRELIRHADESFKRNGWSDNRAKG